MTIGETAFAAVLVVAATAGAIFGNHISEGGLIAVYSGTAGYVFKGLVTKVAP